MRSLGADRSMVSLGFRGCGNVDGAVFFEWRAVRARFYSADCRGCAFTCLQRADLDFRSEAFTRHGQEIGPKSNAFTRLRRASHFPLLAQRKVTKGKGTPASAPIGLRPIGPLRCSSPTGRQTTRPSLASNSLPFPDGRLRSSALLQGTRRSRAKHALRVPRQCCRCLCAVVLRYLRTSGGGVLLSFDRLGTSGGAPRTSYTRSIARRRRRAMDIDSPAEAPRSAAGHRGKANCLRPGMAELFAGRWPASTAGNRSGKARSARMPGCPFLWLLSFGQAKESDSLAAEASETRNQNHQERAKTRVASKGFACETRKGDPLAAEASGTPNPLHMSKANRPPKTKQKTEVRRA
jgi:hypothetical protein